MRALGGCITAMVLLSTSARAQTAPTRADMDGAFSALETAVREARAGSRQITTLGSGKRACIRPLDKIATGASTIRLGVSILAPGLQQFLGLPVPAHIPAGLPEAERWKLAGEQYAMIEVQALPTTGGGYSRARWTDSFDVIEGELFSQPSPQWPVCEVALFRVDDSSIADYVRCACWDGVRSCTWQSPTMGGGSIPVPCPLGVTMGPGTFSGPGAVPKPCVTRFDGPGIDRSWVPGCPR